MKRILVPIAVIWLCVSLPVFSAEEKETPEKAATAASAALKTPAAKLSYALGVQVGSSLRKLRTQLEIEVFLQAVSDIYGGKKPLLTAEETGRIIMDFARKQREAAAQERNATARKNKEEGAKFLAENAKKKGVKTTGSGLQYMVLAKGEGPKPKATDTVKVHYRGTLIGGREFDSSYKRGAPATFALNRVVKGWTEGIQLMNVGGKYKLFMPSDLAYGDQGTGPIPPGAALIFEVELLGVEQQSAPQKDATKVPK